MVTFSKAVDGGIDGVAVVVLVQGNSEGGGGFAGREASSMDVASKDGWKSAKKLGQLVREMDSVLTLGLMENRKERLMVDGQLSHVATPRLSDFFARFISKSSFF